MKTIKPQRKGPTHTIYQEVVCYRAKLYAMCLISVYRSSSRNIAKSSSLNKLREKSDALKN